MKFCYFAGIPAMCGVQKAMFYPESEEAHLKFNSLLELDVF